MRDRSMNHRILTSFGLVMAASAAMAQDAAVEPVAATVGGGVSSIHILVGLAVAQSIIILALGGILRDLAGSGGWAARITGKGGRMLLLLPLLAVASSANAQAYQGAAGPPSESTMFWWLFAANALLFLVICLQLRWIKMLTAVVTPAIEVIPKAKHANAPSWVGNVWAKLNRQVKLEDEQKIELDHDYDGIRELDNVLPPWWLWLFYGTIAWGVLYLVNVHVIKVWPQQDVEYANEMNKAKADVAAYLVTQTNLVDENNVTFTDEAAVINEGRTLYSTFCTACHGADAAGSENSVGPNLTDAYWLHGGGIKNVFRTITHGVPEKGMIAWKTQLQPAEIRAIASYILTRAGQGGPGQKAPQGELWKEEGATAGTDSLQTAAPAAQ